MSAQELPTGFGAVIEASVRVGEMSERRWLVRVPVPGDAVVVKVSLSIPKAAFGALEDMTAWYADRPFRGRIIFADEAVDRTARVVVWFDGVGGGGQA